MRELINKADGSPVKSRIYAVKFLKEKGIAEENLIVENGMFYYDTDKVEVEKPISTETKDLSWETPVIENDRNTQLKIKVADVECKLKAKHPAGQNQRRPYNALEIEIDGETFIFSLKLAEKLFDVEV